MAKRSAAVDPDHTVAETTYGDNSSSFSFTPVAPTDLPHKLLTPLGGAMGKDWGITNYVDVDPEVTSRDYMGGNYAYDTHDGHDLATVKSERDSVHGPDDSVLGHKRNLQIIDGEQLLGH